MIDESEFPVIKNEDEYDAGATLGNGAFVARYPGALGNIMQIGVFHEFTFADWKRNYIFSVIIFDAVSKPNLAI